MSVIKYLKFKFFCGLLFAYAPPASAFGQDGQIILGVFIPVIAFVVIVIIIRLCWEWRHESYQDPSAENRTRMSFYESPLEQFLEAPKSLGTVIYDGTTTRYPILLNHSALYLDNNIMNHHKNYAHDNNNNNNNNNYNNYHLHALFRPTTFPRQESQSSGQRELHVHEREHRHVSEGRGSSDYYHSRNGSFNSYTNSEETQTLQTDRTFFLGQERRHVARRSSSVKDVDMEKWLENRKCARRGSSVRTRTKDFKVIRSDGRIACSKRIGVLSKQSKKGLNIRNDGRYCDQKKSSKVVKTKGNRMNSNFEKPLGKSVKGLKTGICKMPNSIDDVDGTKREQMKVSSTKKRVLRRHSKFRTKQKPLKSCLKTANSRRKPSKRVRFKGVLNEPKQKRSINAIKKKNLATMKTSGKTANQNVSRKTDQKQITKNNRRLSLQPHRKLCRSTPGYQSLPSSKAQSLIVVNNKFEPCASSCIYESDNGIQSENFEMSKYGVAKSFTSNDPTYLSTHSSNGIYPIGEHCSNADGRQFCNLVPLYESNKNLMQNHKAKTRINNQSKDISIFCTEESSFTLPMYDYEFHNCFEFDRHS